jgi:5-formyltetrahydrofolate cyclo-ligase
MGDIRGSASPLSKAGLRESVRARRRAIPPDERTRDAQALADRLAELPELSHVDLVLAYGANREEIDPEPALARLRASGVRVAYPRVSKDALELHEVADPAELVIGSFSIREPRPSAPRVDPCAIDVVFVPAVAFDRRGYRIGYGGGFYDRFLAGLPTGPLRIGLAFDEQILDEVPTQPHDEPVDIIVTPTKVLHTLRDRTRS